jgi:hypothetical protein
MGKHEGKEQGLRLRRYDGEGRDQRKGIKAHRDQRKTKVRDRLQKVNGVLDPHEHKRDMRQ